MRVLIIFNHPAPYKVNAFNELAKYVDLTVLFERTNANDRPHSFYEKNVYNFNHLFLKTGYIGNEGSISNKIKKYIKTNHQKFDVILMNGYSHLAEIKAIRYMSKRHIRFGLFINGGIIKKENFIKKKIKKNLISKASFYLSPTHMSNNYLQYYGAREDLIFNYHYCNFFTSEIHSCSEIERNEIRAKYGFKKDDVIYINPSQYIERKNNITLMSLFTKRKEHLIIVGDGPLKKKYQDFINKNKLNNVHLIPYLNKKEIFALYRASDAHISLSNQDIFGHTILEALACGIPVIASNKIISALEYIKDGINGQVVDSNNKQEIISAMENIKNYSKEAILNSIKNNTFENSAKSIYQIIKDQHE